MNYVILNAQGNVAEIRNSITNEDRMEMDSGKSPFIYETRNDWKTMERAAEIAAQATEVTGCKFLPVDNGDYCYPRYDIVEVPVIGTDVSYAFNGDYYPCGKITKISDSYRRVVAETEGGSKRVFYRVRETASWRMDKTWSLVQGIHNERNPSF